MKKTYKIMEHYSVQADSPEEAARLVGQYNCDIVFYKTQDYLIRKGETPEVQRIYLDVHEM